MSPHNDQGRQDQVAKDPVNDQRVLFQATTGRLLRLTLRCAPLVGVAKQQRPRRFDWGTNSSEERVASEGYRRCRHTGGWTRRFC